MLQEGSRLVSLFEAADESTFLHETAHIFYDDLASFDEETAEDLAEVDAWASWYEGAAKEYEDTPWAMEFAARERAIREAIRTHDEVLEERLKAEWREERFARGFERYLEEGRAPRRRFRKSSTSAAPSSRPPTRPFEAAQAAADHRLLSSRS